MNNISGINGSSESETSSSKNEIELIPIEYESSKVPAESEVKKEESDAKSTEMKSIERVLNFQTHSQVFRGFTVPYVRGEKQTLLALTKIQKLAILTFQSVEILLIVLMMTIADLNKSISDIAYLFISLMICS